MSDDMVRSTAGAEKRSALQSALDAGIAAVRSRVLAGGGAYSQEILHAERAAAAALRLDQELSLGRFVRALNLGSGKPQFLLVWERGRDNFVVLKVYGTKGHVEAAVQRRWQAAEVPTIPIIDSGDEPTSWILMPFVPGRTIPRPRAAAGRAALTQEVSALVAAAHRAIPEVTNGASALHEALAPHLDVVCNALRRQGYAVSASLQARAFEALRAEPAATVHGDLATANLLRSADGGLLLIDAAGYAGHPAFDAARWCARLATQSDLPALMNTWLHTEKLDGEVLGRLLGEELLMVAGVLALVKEEQHQDIRRRSRASRWRLDEAERLLSS